MCTTPTRGATDIRPPTVLATVIQRIAAIAPQLYSGYSYPAYSGYGYPGYAYGGYGGGVVVGGGWGGGYRGGWEGHGGNR